MGFKGNFYFILINTKQDVDFIVVLWVDFEGRLMRGREFFWSEHMFSLQGCFLLVMLLALLTGYNIEYFSTYCSLNFF